MKKAVFLDRDGTINVDYGYISSPKDFHLFPNSAPSLKTLQKMGYLLVIITNQSGIGRGYYTLEDFFSVNETMHRKLKSFGVKIDDIFFCPHNPDAKCSCRKPSHQMVLAAAEKWDIDLKRSFFIGDKTADILCGKNAGCRTLLIKQPDRRKNPGEDNIVSQSDYSVDDLGECVPIIKRISGLQENPRATAVIPARLQSQRLPHKLLQSIDASPLIKYTYKNISSMGIFKDILIATDSRQIRKAAQAFGAKVLMTSPLHKSGTSRISEICRKITTPVIINVQGDEPLLSVSHLEKLIAFLTENRTVLSATGITRIRNKKQMESPSVVKAVKDNDDFALYFSRYPVPFLRDKTKEQPVKYKHLGIYGYQKVFFDLYKKFVPSPLEESEKLEQLTFLANGIKMKLIETENDTLGIDTPEDLAFFRRIVSRHPAYFRNLLTRR